MLVLPDIDKQGLPRLPRHGLTCMVKSEGTLDGWLWWALGDWDGLLMQGLC